MLVEPNPILYKRGVERRRNVTSAAVCLSKFDHASLSKYDMATESTEIATSSDISFQCIPLFSLLLSLGNPTVNYLSLDIEGGEFQVLQTIPWEKVDIQVMSIETHFLGK